MWQAQKNLLRPNPVALKLSRMYKPKMSISQIEHIEHIAIRFFHRVY
jgi:hypothetical protein